MPVQLVTSVHWNTSVPADGRVVGPANTGHTAHPSWPGTFTGGTFNGGEPGSNTTIMFADFTGTVDVGGFQAPIGSGASNVVFEGCRFQFSANVDDVTGDATSVLVRLFADGPVTFRYCTFQPSVANYPTRLTGEEIQANPATWVSYGKSYQYAIAANNGWNSRAKAVTVEHCDFWGFGNAVDLLDSTVATPHIVRYSWFHHGGDPWQTAQPSSAFHNDCWLVNQGNYFGAVCEYNRMEIWGNTNCLAWQGGPFNDCVVRGNVFGGDNETVHMASISTRLQFTDNFFASRIGRGAVAGSSKPNRDWNVTDSGTGSFWRRNKFLIGVDEAPANFPAAKWGAPSNDGLYWHPADTDLTVRTVGGGHAADYTG